jgi:hypothetical protein
VQGREEGKEERAPFTGKYVAGGEEGRVAVASRRGQLAPPPSFASRSAAFRKRSADGFEPEDASSANLSSKTSLFEL